jgi:putative hydrolase of the HAD superfamily
MALQLDQFPVLLLDMHSTFMFGEDRFGSGEDFGATYRRHGGVTLPAPEVEQCIRAVHAYLSACYADPRHEDDFPSVAEALRTVKPELPVDEQQRLIAVFSEHERGTVPEAFAEALQRLAGAHELRLISNIWAAKAPWIEELERARVSQLFARMVFSSDGRSIKPSPRLFSEAVRDLPCAPADVLMIGDSLRRDMYGAKRAGLATLWICGLDATLNETSAKWVDYRIPSLLSLRTDLGAHS